MSRERAENFNSKEKCYLSNLIREKGYLIESSKNDAGVTKLKAEAWSEMLERIAINFPNKPESALKK